MAETWPFSTTPVYDVCVFRSVPSEEDKEAKRSLRKINIEIPEFIKQVSRGLFFLITY